MVKLTLPQRELKENCAAQIQVNVGPGRSWRCWRAMPPALTVPVEDDGLDDATAQIAGKDVLGGYPHLLFLSAALVAVELIGGGVVRRGLFIGWCVRHA